MGLILMEVGGDVDKINDGDELAVDVEAGTVANKTTGETIKAQPVPPFMQEILSADGLVGYVRKRLRHSEG
jgi:3-isopropylmalate/(R)-2-methylmalate dehydratase small subunit